MKRSVLFIALAGIIAAIYVALTLLLAPLSYGPLQFRLSEVLTVLPALTPAAIPGLFLGCLLSNLMNPSPLGLIDIIFGSLATLLSAWLTSLLGCRIRESQVKTISWATVIALLPPVLINGIVVGFYLPFLIPEIGTSVPAILGTMLSVAASEAVVVYVIGWPLLAGLRRANLKMPGKE